MGEIVRQQVADHREKMYERAGNFSTYLFRVDDDIVIDATRKGNIARLMNVRLFLFNPFLALLYAKLHGKNPHGTGWKTRRNFVCASPLTNSAKQVILPGQELTYDYKCTSSPR